MLLNQPVVLPSLRGRFYSNTIILVLLLIGILFFPLGVLASTNVGGRISTDTTWTTSGSPYIVTSAVQFYGTTSTPITLTIQAGVIVKFQSGKYLQIGSTGYPAILSAAGSAQSPIIFTSDKDDTAGGDTNGDGSATSPAAGNWSYLYLREGSTPSELDHVEVRYGGSGGNGSLYIVGVSPTLENSLIKYIGTVGIKISNGSPTLTSVTVENTGSDGISISSSTCCTAPVISQSLIKNAGRYGIYMSGANTAPEIEGSTIETPTDYGLYIDQAAPTVQDSTIDNNLFIPGNQTGMPTFTGNTLKNFSTKTARISIAMLQDFQTQNTLTDINSSTVLELNGEPVITTDTTLGLFWKIYHVVAGNVAVGGTPPVVLTINPGVTVKFSASKYLTIGSSGRGVLVARGTSTDPILLTTLNAAPNNWRGIVMGTDTMPGASLLEYVTVDQGGKSNAAIDASYTAFTMNHCEVKNSTMHGIRLTSSDLTMQFSKVHDNSQRGLHVPTSGSSDNSRVTIRNSDFYSNSQGAILNEQSTLSVDARDTWWGHASGPGGSGPGSGNSVSTKVLYDPWLGTAYTYPFAITEAYPSAVSFTQSGGVTTLAGELTQNGDWDVVVKDSSSTTMKSDSGSGFLINTLWDGTDTSSTPQSNGTYTFQMDATAGSDTAAPVIGRVVLNSSLPTAIITDPEADELILGSSATITGTASASSGFSSYTVDVGLGTSPFQYFTVATSTGAVTNGTLGTWTLQTNPPSGYYQIRLKAVATGGTAETTQLVRIDHTPPVPPQITQPTSPATTQPITVTGTAEPDSTVELFVNEESVGEETADADGEFSFSDVALELGLNSLKARATDNSDNVGSFSDQTSVVYLPSGQNLIEILAPEDGSTVYQ